MVRFGLPSHRILRELVKLAAVFAVLAVGGLLVAASGVLPIKASSGHWPITRWFLSFSMKRSVSTHSLGLKPPSLDERHLIFKGAGHFEIGCRPCHGSPDLPSPRVAQQMTPRPPDLSATVHHWDPPELFYIVKHGVKFTGMPAWPTQVRDDEVWAMTAFLLRLPDLDARQYQRLVGKGAADNQEAAPLEGLLDPAATPPDLVDNCARCHGSVGQGGGDGAFPLLAGQAADYLQAALKAYANGTRPSGIMEPIAAGLSPGEMELLARYYSALEVPPPTTAPASAEAIQRGEALALGGLEHRVPACSSCHGPHNGKHNPNYPSLAGQSARYLLLQLRLFRSTHRGGSEYAHLMRPVASQLSEEQMQEVALYYASLAAGASSQ